MVGNIKESVIPYIKKHFKMAKLSYDIHGPVSPSADPKKNDDLVPEEEVGKENSSNERSVSQVDFNMDR